MLCTDGILYNFYCTTGQLLSKKRKLLLPIWAFMACSRLNIIFSNINNALQNLWWGKTADTIHTIPTTVCHIRNHYHMSCVKQNRINPLPQANITGRPHRTLPDTQSCSKRPETDVIYSSDMCINTWMISAEIRRRYSMIAVEWRVTECIAQKTQQPTNWIKYNQIRSSVFCIHGSVKRESIFNNCPTRCGLFS